MTVIDEQHTSEGCMCSGCVRGVPDADSQMAARYKKPDPAGRLPKASKGQVRYIEGLSRKLTKGEASRLIEHLRSTTAGRLWWSKKSGT